MLQTNKFGTAPVFFTAISTILGAILFLRFGYAVGTLGFFGVLLIILLGHLVTVPTALAISEIATNKRVEGGGEYFIISRSFGLNIGATIGLALYLSQSISVAFYVIAFTEAFQFLFDLLLTKYDFFLPRQAISIPMMLLLGALVIKKGANLGVKALYVVVAILLFSLLLFFMGTTEHATNSEFTILNGELRNMGDFFTVFAIIFPAFTGMTAGVGLSGDLRNPSKSIPLGTLTATVIGMIIYVFISYKLALSASVNDLVNDQFVMGKVAIWGAVIIPIGLAASTVSSALGSIMVAPRTLQALSQDRCFPMIRLNGWLAKSREKDGEPINASLITCAIALAFVALGNVNVVAQIISMFFMITYGSLCLISFLHHFGTSPSYRPTFKSKWYISLLGFVIAVWVMFKINAAYSILAFVLLIALYLYISYYHKGRKNLASIFANSIFQLNRNIQLYLQKSRLMRTSIEWRPSALCVSKYTFEREGALQLMDWISHKYGFGTYLHHIEDYYSTKSSNRSKELLNKLITNYAQDGHVYIDTIISPSYTSAIAQAIQISGISGMENNMVIFDYDHEHPDQIDPIVENFNLVRAGNFDVCIYSVTRKPMNYKNGIHVWIKSFDEENANLMIILSYIILGHPDWKGANITIYNICKRPEMAATQMKMNSLIQSGRLPITQQNVRIIVQEGEQSYKEIITEHSTDAALTIAGFREESIRHQGRSLFEGFEEMGNMLFVHSWDTKVLD